MFNRFKLNISLTQLCSKVTGIYGCVEFITLSAAQYDALCGIHSAHYCTHAYVYKE